MEKLKWIYVASYSDKVRPNENYLCFFAPASPQSFYWSNGSDYFIRSGRELHDKYSGMYAISLSELLKFVEFEDGC